MTDDMTKPIDGLPMFAPQPDLIVNVDGNPKWTRWYQDRVREVAEQARREWEAVHGPGSADRQRQ